MRPRPSQPDPLPPFAGASNDAPYLALSGAEAKQYWVWLLSGVMCRQLRLERGVPADDRDRLEWACDACDDLLHAFERSLDDQSLTTYGSRDDLLTRLDRGLDPAGVVIFLRYLQNMHDCWSQAALPASWVFLEVVASARALLSKMLGVDDETCLRWARMKWVLPAGDTRLAKWGVAHESVFHDDGVYALPVESNVDLDWQRVLTSWAKLKAGPQLPHAERVVEQRTDKKPGRWQYAFVAYFEAEYFRSDRTFGVTRTGPRLNRVDGFNGLILEKFLDAFRRLARSEHWRYDQLSREPDPKRLQAFVDWLYMSRTLGEKQGTLGWSAKRAWAELTRVTGGAIKPPSEKKPTRQIFY